MSDLVINVKQISNYPNRAASSGTETLLVQAGGLGAPYQSILANTFVSTALNQGPALGVGTQTPIDAFGAQIFTDEVVLPPDGVLTWNAYIDTSDTWRPWRNGSAASLGWDQTGGFDFAVSTAGSANDALTWSTVMGLSEAGNLSLPYGTLTVARDPIQLMDVATLNWVSNNTVASFNDRIGRVTLNQNDIYAALCLDSAIATQQWTVSAINAGIGDLITTHPFVFSWNGRCGAVYLTLSDITCTFYQPGQQPVSPTPALTSNDDSIATTAWVTEYIANEFAGGGGNLATQTWVLANTVNSFNGRMGPVILTLADVVDVGAAPLNGPNFSGVPTAPTAAQGQATGQIATTAFVQQAIAHNTAGVSTFNTRTGDVVLSNADIVAAGAIANPSPNLTGSPTAPTAAPGTSTPQIANTQFVTTAIANAVLSFNGRTGAVTLSTADITGAGGAPIVSPAFSSVPTAPTAAPGTNTVQLATCAFVTAALNAAGGVSSFNGRTGAVDLIGNDVSAAGGLVNPSVNLTGIPTAPTATAGTNTNQIATTSFVATALSAGTVTSFNARAGAVTLTGADIQTAGGALLAGPAFTGVPTAPTAPANTNNTQLATTQFVQSAILADTSGVTSFNTRTGAITLTTADITGAGGAPIASPVFTGVPAGPTAAPGTNTTQLATTSFVAAALAASGVSSFNGRSGAVTLIANDISAAGGALLAGPTFTGVPAAPTAAPGTNTTQLASTAFVQAAVSQPATVAPLMDGTAAVGTSLLYARQDHVHPSDTSRAPIASPTFTGVPAAPTATAGTNTTQVATTQFVTAAVGAIAPAAGANCLDNSGFLINQRGYVTGTALAVGAYGHDRWKAGAGGCTYTFVWSGGPATTITITAGTLQQVIEVTAVMGGSYTLSWTGTAGGRAYTTGSPTGAYLASPRPVTITAGVSYTIEFNTGTLGQVRLESGTVATPWRPIMQQAELTNCQRFAIALGFYIGGTFAQTDNVALSAVMYPNAMRGTPTLTYLSGPNLGGAATAFGTPTVGGQYFVPQVATGSAGAYSVGGTVLLSADL